MKSHSTGLLDRTFPYWSLLPAVIVFVVLSLYPMLNLIVMSTSVYRFENGAEIATFAPMQNFSYIADDAVLRSAIINTIVFVVVAVSAEMAIGLALAIYASRVSEWKGTIRTLIILPILVPPVAIGSMWRLMYNYDFGVFNQALAVVGLGPVNWLGDTRFSLLSVIIVDVWHWVPFIFLILFAAVEGLPGDVIEAARVDGARQGQVTRYVVLPLMKPAIIVAFTFRAILAFKTFDEVFLLTSGGPGTSSELISLHLYKVFFSQNNLGYGAMLSLTVILMVVSFLLVARRFTAQTQA